MLYFIRHGQTDYNLNKKLAGRVNIALNEFGKLQAKEIAITIKDINIDIIFCSPLIRAQQTCSIINENRNVEVILKEELVERDFGKYEGKNYSKIDGEKCWNYFDNTYDKKIETLKDVFGRVYNFLDNIKNRYKDKNVLIVAHNDIGRAIHCYFNGLPIDGNVKEINFSNAKIYKYEW